jgi:hypothetical protein
LAVRILKIRPNIATGRSGTSSDYGSLTETDLTPMLHDPVPEKKNIWRIDAKISRAWLNISFPLLTDWDRVFCLEKV